MARCVVERRSVRCALALTDALKALHRTGQALAGVAMGEIKACSTCKTESAANELIICYICGQGHCRNCPSSCDCTVTNYLNMLEVGLKLTP
jgi:hypothetical protein